MPQWAVVSKEKIQETLATTTTDASGVQLLEPLKTMATASGFPLKILEDKNISNSAEVHVTEGDLWGCLEGEATFTLGGELFEPQHRSNADGTPNPNELFAQAIQGGETVILRPGDWLWVPAGVSHQHGAVGVARMAIIKIPAPR